MKLRTLMAIGFATTCFAQGPGFGPGRPGGPGMGMGMGQGMGQGMAQAPGVDKIKAYLTLTDAQVQALQSIERQLQQSVQTVRTEMQQKQTALHDQLEKGSTDAAALGRLLLDIQNLRKRVETAATSAHDQAVNVLNAAQKTKLKTLEDAMKVRAEIQEAAALHLLTPPQGLDMKGGFGHPFGGPGRMGMGRP